jgi:hypothetical protein
MRTKQFRPALVGLWLTAIALAIMTVPASAALPAKALQLIQRADVIYADGAQIVATAPTNANSADETSIVYGKHFGAEERAFQDAVSALPATGELRSPAAQATVRLGQFDNFNLQRVYCDDVMRPRQRPRRPQHCSPTGWRVTSYRRGSRSRRLGPDRIRQRG